MTEQRRIVESDDLAPSALKTQRYLRLSLVFLIAALFIGVTIQTLVISWDPIEFGWQLLPSISHYFYTPARIVFVSVLIGASLALLSLSGRRRPSVYLDIAAVFAPLIAIVPTGIAPPADADAGTAMTCVGSSCVPADVLAEVRVSVATYVVVVIVVVAALYGIRRLKNLATTSAHGVVSTVAVVAAVGLAALAFLPGWSRDFPFNFPLIGSVHFAAVLLFFGSFAAVPILYGWRPPEADETPPTPRQRTIYRVVACLMVADLLFLVVVFIDSKLEWGLFGQAPVVLIGEAVALILFAWFWWQQTLQRWDDLSVPFIVAGGADAAPTTAPDSEPHSKLPY